ncbi:FkbM family methyltransferase [Azonexus fungiphilus]|uniref:FkbM family methyltransferase n=1 Tax=Azonexus fungiphilus TaxID=146940 RepID=UPI00156B9551|nr:FkbM family methyltransferase [Azonexus fungiphilus]NHC07259.1 FkbM family methyltransferase [Azonexus fungiphilus]
MPKAETNPCAIPDALAYDALVGRLSLKPKVDLALDRPLWIFGAGQFAKDASSILCSAGFRIRGFIETEPRRKEFLGLPVCSWEQVSPEQNDLLVIAIHNRAAPLDKLAELARANGFTHIAYPWDLHHCFPKEVGWRFWLSGPAPLLGAMEEIKALNNRLADEESRRCLYRIVSFRLGLDDSYASFRHELPQYFNSLSLPTLPTRAIHYVDGGAYDGDSVLQLSASHQIAQAYLFEPDPENYRKLVSRLQTAPFIAQCLPLGLMNSHCTLSFSGGQGEGGNISSDGNIHVTCVALDQLVGNTPIDFIKLDIEGTEIPALLGASRILERHRPTLAISLYHRPSDLWEIPALLERLFPDYRLYIRQHHFNSFDSVLYAIPGNPGS